MRYRKTFREAWDDVNKDRNTGDKHVSAKDDPKDKDGDKEKAESDEVQRLKNEIQMLKISLENEKNKTVKPEPNKDTGEVPLRTGVAQAILDKNTPMPKVGKPTKKEIKVGGKTNIEVNPKVDIGIYSGGKTANTGNLH